MSQYFHEMKYSLAFLFAVIAFGVLAVSNLIIRPVDESGVLEQYSVVAHVKTGNIFESFFSEPFETMILLVKDGRFFTFTTHHERFIFIPPSYVSEYLKRSGVEPGDIVIIVHNHSLPSKFSPGDNAFYHHFRRQGFRGSFCIYYPFSGEVLMKEN